MRAAGPLLLACVLLAALLPAAAAAQDPAGQGATADDDRVRVYGVEIESSLERDRVLVFADGLLRPKLVEVDRASVMLTFPGSRLDPSTPKRLTPKDPRVAAVKLVSVFETARDPKEVRLTIRHSPGVSPSLSQRGGQVALDFDRPGDVVRPTPSARGRRTLEARWLNEPLPDAIERLARFLEVPVVIDPGVVKGNLSVEAPRPVTREEAAALFDSLLLLKGLAAVEGPGGSRKIVPLAANPGPWVAAVESQPGGLALVTMIHLDEVDASLAVEALAPIVGGNSLVQAYTPTNAVLLGGVQARLARIAGLLRELDDQGATRVVIVRLRHADAAFVADALTDALEAERSFQVWPDERTGRVIVRARRQTLPRVRRLIAGLDRPASGEGSLQVIPVQYADPELLATMLRDLSAGDGLGAADEGLTRGARSLAGRPLAVSVHGETHSLVVQADPETIDVVRELLAEIDRPPERVMVEVGFTEVSMSSDFSISFDALVPVIEPDDATDWVSALVLSPSGKVLATEPTGDGFFGRVARSPILVPVIDGAGNTVVLPVPRETAVFTADQQEVRTRLMQRPRLALLSGEEHELFVGDNIPVPQQSTAESTNPLRTSQTVERRDTGVVLRVEPTVPEDGPIALDLYLEVSTFSGSIAGGPTFIERELETTVYLEAGRSAVIGSARLPREAEIQVGVPLLMDIPILGWFFRSTQQVVRNIHLIVTVSAVRQNPEAEGLTQWMIERLAERSEEH
ncbi:MAG: secretin N-terminal domain-containing protein, partial [Myxococcota bacterium]